MKKHLTICIIISLILSLFGCTKSSTFSITFLDVGQGDAALVECDGHYMLIDGGDVSAGDVVYNKLESKGIQHLDILVMSHLHSDHIGDLQKALTNVSKIDLTLSNSKYCDTTVFNNVESTLRQNDSHITIPHENDKYKLGKAKIEIVDSTNRNENDSLVLLITYGKNRFMFTGDIEDEAQRRITERYQYKNKKTTNIDVMKIPHHGSSSNQTDYEAGIKYLFYKEFLPTYAVISVGKDNKYGHPHQKTLDRINDAGSKIYRTDYNGDITVISDGRNVTIETER